METWAGIQIASDSCRGHLYTSVPTCPRRSKGERLIFIMHVTTAVPPHTNHQEHMYNPPGSTSWLTVLQPPCKTAAPSDEDTSPRHRQIKPSSTSAHTHHEDPKCLSTSGSQDVPSSVDNAGGSSSAPRRTVFTRHQLSELETRFREQTFLSKEERAQMAEDLGLTERQIMIWFQNRRGRLKRRGPSDNAYTADKLKELNTRRPYPFLYGLLSSMQYRYPEGHQHPYQHLIADRNQGNTNSSPQTGHGSDTAPPHTQPVNLQLSVTSHNDVSTSVKTSPSNSPPRGFPHNVTVTGSSISGPMPPNVSVHQMTWSSQKQRVNGTTNGDPHHHHHSPPGIQGGYPGVPGWMASQAGPVRHAQPIQPYHEHRPYHHQGHYHSTPWTSTTMSMQTPPPYHYPMHPTSVTTPLPQQPYCPPQGHIPYTTEGHFTPLQRHRGDNLQSGRDSPSGERLKTTPPPATQASPISSAGSASPPDLVERQPHVAVVQATCLGPNAVTTSGFPSALSSSNSVVPHATFHDFNPQFDFGFVPDFPDITSTLYASQTC